jgi:hypothetical protein
MSGTPETDAEARLLSIDCDDSCATVYFERDGCVVYGDFVLGDFARKLERERNSARAKFVAAIDGRDMANEEADKLREENAKLRNIAKRAICLLRMRGYACTASMRDSLRAELDQLKEGAK